MMFMFLESFCKTFVWEYRETIVPVTTVAIPLTIEVGCFFYEYYKSSKEITAKLTRMKHAIYDVSHRRDGENIRDFQRRCRKNAKVTGLFAVTIGTTFALPFFIISSAYALPAALTAVSMLAKFLIKIQQHPQFTHKAANYIAGAFQQREGETIEDFHFRRRQAIMHMTKCALIFAVCVTTTCVLAHVAILMSRVSSVWELTKFIPFQTEYMAFLEYLAVALKHALECIQYGKKDEKSRAAYHGISAMFGVFFPLWYLLLDSKIRLHHSFSGLLLQLAPTRVVRTFGCFITLDSFLYYISPERGYLKRCDETYCPHKGPTCPYYDRFVNYDYMNAVYSQFSTVLQGLVAISLLQKISEELLKKPSKQA